MKYINLKNSQKIEVTRYIKGEIGPESRQVFVTTVDQAKKDQDFSTSSGTVQVTAQLVDHERSEYNGSQVNTTRSGHIKAKVPEDWEIE